jgi:predicted RNA-binding Zn ribbon-like protein
LVTASSDVERYAADRRGPAPPELRALQDFVNTRDGLRALDTLETPTQLHRFLVSWDLLTETEVVEPGELLEARKVREALRAFLDHDRRGMSQPQIQLLDDIGRRARMQWTFAESGQIGLAAGRRGVVGALGALLAPLLSAGITGTLERLKTCRNCGWLFYDRSKNRSGSWCSMDLCGSRAKSKRYYWKSRSDTPPSAAGS